MALITPIMPVTTVSMSYVDAFLKSLDDDDKIVALARKYHNGKQETYMTPRVEEFLKIHGDEKLFCLNVCRTITLAVKDELSVSGFNTTEAADVQGMKLQAKWAWDLWTRNHMDAVQSEVHESALSDRETFIIADWDPTRQSPRFVHNYRYTSLEDDDTGGQGCWMVYENDDVNQPAICAVKQWVQTTFDSTGSPLAVTRRTIYYPDHIEKWTNAGGTWGHYANPDLPPEPWPIPWKAKDGKPLGIPVIHFRNVGMMPEAWDAIPIQDAINKTLVDILASNDLTAFQMLAAIGWYPTTDGNPPKDDGSNLLKVGPGQFVGTKDPNGKLQVVKGNDPTPLVNTLKDLVLLAAQVTSTPTSRFTTTKLIASQETLKEQNIQLKKKAQDRRTLFGDAWEACIELARRISNTFGTEPELDETVVFSTIWLNNQTLDDLKAKKDLGIPEETLWSEAGYTTEQIARMIATPEYQATIAGWQSSIYMSQHPELRAPKPSGESNTDVKSVTNGEKPKGSE